MKFEMAGKILVFALFFIKCTGAEDKEFLMNLEHRLEDKLCKYVNDATKYLEEYNDENLGNSEIGRFLGYMDFKPKYNEESGRKSKAMKKMSMALMPLIFHIGASSTWMLITTLLAGKSVAIGLLLLIFKIAVSSAKVASFFTSLKGKQNHDYSWSPPIEHGHYRSLGDLAAHQSASWNNHYTTEWVNEPPTNDYKTIPMYARISRSMREMNEAT